MPATWEILPCPSLSSSVLPLLFKYKSDGVGYTLYLTDLTCIWSETLDYEQVIQRSINEETSIEPRDNSDQLKILLAKIGDGLRGSDETNLNLLPGDDEKHLKLNIFARLPSPFLPLQWSVYLKPLNSEALRAEMLIPLLADQKALRQQVASLLVHIQEKDKVILKLTDNLESSGVDMAMMFPGAVGAKVGRRHLGREMAAKVVPGLAAFNVDSWKTEMSEAGMPTGGDNELIMSLFPSELPDSKSTTDEYPSNAWWNTLQHKSKSAGDSSELLIKNDKERARTGCQSHELGKVEGEATELAMDNEFERQETPPALKRTAIMVQIPEALDGPGTEEQRIAVPHSKPRKLGLVGGGRGHVSVLDAQQADTSVASGNVVQHSSLNANDHVVGSANQDEQPPGPFLPSSSTPVRVKHRLGVIGGKRKNLEGDVSDTPTKPASSRASPYRLTEKTGNTEKLTVSTTPAKTLGEEVHEHQDTSNQTLRMPSVPGSTSGIPSSPRTDVTPPLGSSEERANRKRAELKRVLEGNAKAPIQKRHRF